MLSIEAHNAAGVHHFKQGITPFTHMTREEFAAYTELGRPKKQRTQEQQAFHESMPVFDGAMNTINGKIQSGIVLDVDWRKVPGVVTPVKNQGQCGSCWTFGASGALEGAYALTSSATKPTKTVYSGLTLSPSTGFFGISEQNFVDCDDIMSLGCNGGFAESAWTYAAIQKGAVSELDYPYVMGNWTDDAPQTNACKKSVVSSSLIKDTYPVRNYPYTNVPAFNVTALELAVRQQPVQVSIQAGPSFAGAPSPFQNYNGGILTVEGGCAQNLDHSVLIVGYHTDPVYANQSYWIVKNSWTASWGVDGYFYVQKSAENACGILSQPSFPNLKVKDSALPPAQPPTPNPTPNPPTFSTPGSGYYEYHGYISSRTSGQPAAKTAVTFPAGHQSISAVLPLAANITLKLDDMVTNFAWRESTPYLVQANATVATYAVAIHGNLTVPNAPNKVNTYILQFDIVSDPQFSSVTFYINSASMMPYQLPITAATVQPMIFGGVNQTVATDIHMKGVGVKDIMFMMTANYPTPNPTTAPPPIPPPPSGSSILGTLTTTTYGSAGCAGTVEAEKRASYGLCHYDTSSSSYLKVVPGTPTVTNLNQAYNLPLYFNYYADSACTQLTSESTSGVMVNSCSTGPAFGTSQFINYVPNLVTSSSKNIAPLLMTGGAQLIQYPTASACASADMSQVLTILAMSTSGCVTTSSDAYGFQSWATTCVGSGFTTNIYVATGCDAASGVQPESPYSSSAMSCNFVSTGGMYGYVTSTCTSGSGGGGGGGGNSQTSGNAEAPASKAASIGLGVTCGLLVLLLIFTIWFYRNKAEKDAAIGSATYVKYAEPLPPATAGQSSNPIHKA